MINNQSQLQKANSKQRREKETECKQMEKTTSVRFNTYAQAVAECTK